MVRCSNETPDGPKHEAYPLVVTVMDGTSEGADGALCLQCISKAAAAQAPTPPPPS